MHALFARVGNQKGKNPGAVSEMQILDLLLQTHRTEGTVKEIRKTGKFYT